MKTETKNKINWKAALEFVTVVFPQLKSDLEENLAELQLKKSEPYIQIREYPPRISLIFIKKEYAFPDEKDEELKANQSETSKIVAKVAERYDLNAMAGSIRERVLPRDAGRFVWVLGDYTFKPEYKEFVK